MNFRVEMVEICIENKTFSFFKIAIKSIVNLNKIKPFKGIVRFLYFS
jgi:hypothetical protein